MMIMGKWIFLVNIPKCAAGNATGIGIDNLLPVARRILRVPGVQTSSALRYGLLARFVGLAMNGKEGVNKGLWRIFVGLEHAPGKCREVLGRVNLLELETSHFRRRRMFWILELMTIALLYLLRSGA